MVPAGVHFYLLLVIVEPPALLSSGLMSDESHVVSSQEAQDALQEVLWAFPLRILEP